MMKEYYVYILTNWTGDVLYTGVTNNLERRMEEHRSGTKPGFSSRYNLSKRVFFETGLDINGAIAREKQIKRWRRQKKNDLVESVNPEWRDLYEDWHFSSFTQNPSNVIPSEVEGSLAEESGKDLSATRLERSGRDDKMEKL